MADAENPAQRFVDTEVPGHYRPLIPPAIQRGYDAVDHLIEQTEWLNNPSGKCQRGQLIVKAVEDQMMRLIRAGSLPFEPSWEDYASPTGKHLVLRSARSRLTINQVMDNNEKPRHARFREEFGLENTKFLFPEWNAEAENQKTLRHLLILHGYQSLDFVTVGFPHPRRKRLIYKTPNLMIGLHVVPKDEEIYEREGPTEAPDLEAIDDLEKFIRDNDLE